MSMSHGCICEALIAPKVQRNVDINVPSGWHVRTRTGCHSSAVYAPQGVPQVPFVFDVKTSSSKVVHKVTVPISFFITLGTGNQICYPTISPVLSHNATHHRCRKLGRGKRACRWLSHAQGGSVLEAVHPSSAFHSHRSQTGRRNAWRKKTSAFEALGGCVESGDK